MALITEHYRQQNAQLLKENPNYAIAGRLRRHFVREVSEWGRKPILDYGAGRQTLSSALGPAYKVYAYDPCVEAISASPEPCEVVYCGDVLEHIEPECLSDVLADLRRCVIGKGLFTIALAPSTTTLPDGRNTHLIIESPDWWRGKLIEAGFTILREKMPEEIMNIVWFEVC